MRNGAHDRIVTRARADCQLLAQNSPSGPTLFALTSTSATADLLRVGPALRRRCLAEARFNFARSGTWVCCTDRSP